MKKNAVEVLVFIYSWLFGGISNCYFGLDFMYDFHNYHFYNPWAFITGRVGFDVMPACVESYFNPYLDLCNYFLIRILNNFPYVYLFVCAIFYGFFTLLTYKIAKFIFQNDKFKLWLSFLIGITSSIVIFNIGATNNDIIVADFTLLSIYLILKYINSEKLKYLIISALILGVSVTLKLTNGIFIPGIFAGLLVIKNSRFKRAFLWLSITILAFLITDFSWMYKLWINFHNPMFPYLNGIFKSDLISSDNVLQSDFKALLPRGIKDFILYPFLFMDKLNRHGFERLFQDYRLCLLYISSIFFIVFSLFKNWRERFMKESFKPILFLYVMFGATYIVWLNLFANVRYIMPIFAISGIMIFSFFIFVCEKFTSNSKILTPLLLIYSIFLFSTTIYPNMNTRIKIYNCCHKLMFVSDAKIPDNATVFVKSGSAFIAVFQNPKAKYVYADNPRLMENGKRILSEKYTKKVTSELDFNNTYAIMPKMDPNKKGYKDLIKSINYYLPNNKITELNNCKIIITNYETGYRLCKLENK